MTYIDSQSEYNSETDQAGTLLGNRSAIGIQNDIRNKLIYSVPGVDADLNQLSAIGLKFNDAGQLFVN
jgi:flagellar capping protein FliD